MSDSNDIGQRRRLVLLLGDQLSSDISALRHADRHRDRILMAEVAQEATYVRHHKKKIAFLFSAMRHFTADLTDAGWAVDYVELDDSENSGSLPGEVERALGRHECDQVLVTEPGEWRLSRDRLRLSPSRNRLRSGTVSSNRSPGGTGDSP